MRALGGLKLGSPGLIHEHIWGKGHCFINHPLWVGISAYLGSTYIHVYKYEHIHIGPYISL
jgi:hypothetical protein